MLSQQWDVCLGGVCLGTQGLAVGGELKGRQPSYFLRVAARFVLRGNPPPGMGQHCTEVCCAEREPASAQNSIGKQGEVGAKP